ILDLCSRRVVGWATSANNDTSLALAALGRAKASRMPLVGLVHHSDRGSVYASGEYRDALKALGAVASMSRKGDCWDNAVAESFFATIKGELIDERDFKTRAEQTPRSVTTLMHSTTSANCTRQSATSARSSSN